MLESFGARWRRAGGPATDAHPVERVSSQPCAASWRVSSIARFLAALNSRSKAFQLFGTLALQRLQKDGARARGDPRPADALHLGPRAPAARSAWPPTGRSRRVRRCPSNSRHRPASWRAAVPEADATPFALRALQSRACSKPCRRTPTTTQRTRARPRRVPRVPARTRRRRRLSRRPLRPHAAVPVARRRAACRAPGRHRLLPAHPADPGGGRLPVGVVPGALSGVPRMNPPPRHLAARRPLAHRQPTARRCALGSQYTRRRG